MPQYTCGNQSNLQESALSFSMWGLDFRFKLSAGLHAGLSHGPSLTFKGDFFVWLCTGVQTWLCGVHAYMRVGRGVKEQGGRRCHRVPREVSCGCYSSHAVHSSLSFMGRVSN